MPRPLRSSSHPQHIQAEDDMVMKSKCYHSTLREDNEESLPPRTFQVTGNSSLHSDEKHEHANSNPEISEVSSDSESIGAKVERKIDEIGTVISSFVENKKVKMQKNTDPFDQDPPPFSYSTNAHQCRNTCFSPKEAEYLFYIFRKCCEYPKEHMPFENFRIFFPDSLNDAEIQKIFCLFQDDVLLGMGLETISFKSFLHTLSVISSGSTSEKANQITRAIFRLCDVSVLPDASSGSSITAPIEKVIEVIKGMSQIVLPTISPLPRLWRQKSDGSVFYPMDPEIEAPESSEDEEASTEEVEDIIGDNCSLCTFNNRVIAFTNSSSHQSELHQTWISDFVQSLVATPGEDEIVQYSNLHARIQQHLDLSEDKRRQVEDRKHWNLLLSFYGAFNYFKNLILDTMRYDLNAPKAINTFISEKEGFLIKSSGIGVFERWKKHWCILRDGFLWYYDCDEAIPKLHEAERVVSLHRASVNILNDQCFELQCPGYSRKFRAASRSELDHWVSAIFSHMGLDMNTKPRDGFAPLRSGIHAKWYVDGKDTMDAMVESMLSAKEEIFIADWFLSPFIYLRRERNEAPFLDDRYRLDNLLVARAEAGVMIYILPWNETKIVMDLGSAFSEEYFNKLHENIKVIRHPIVAPVKWSHHQKIVVVDQQIAFIGGVDLCLGRWDERSHPVTDIDTIKKWPGKDYYNPLYKEFEMVHDPWDDLVDRERYPRMPWHDVHMSVDGSAAKDVSRNFIQRWNHHKEIVQSPHPYLIPSNTISKSVGYNSVQVLRSLSEWSSGVAPILERSIYDGYIQAITNARKFIYIENQFFISSLAGDSIKNQLAQCILDKLFNAIENNQDFKVIIVLPQHPEGMYYREAVTTRYIMHLQYNTISRGGNSMLEQLHARFPDTDLRNYIGFYTLRNYGQLKEYYVHEQIYVHAKILIVDDRVAIIGSANTNDRSMTGERDSEIAIKVFGGEKIPTKMNGSSWSATKFVHSLRVSLWQEHLGLLGLDESLVEDPMDSFDLLWKPVASRNAEIYRTQFPNVPHSADSDSPMFKLAHETETKLLVTPSSTEALKEIQGHIVDFDMQYCKGQNLALEGIDNLMEDDIFA